MQGDTGSNGGSGGGGAPPPAPDCAGSRVARKQGRLFRDSREGFGLVDEECTGCRDEREGTTR